MPDNLSVSITADTSKLRQELKIAEAALRSLRTEERKAADEAAKTGETSRIAKVTPQVQAAEKAVARLREEFVRANRTMEISNREIIKLGASLGNMHKSAHAASQIMFEAFGGGLAAGGVAAGILVAVHAAERFAEYLNSITEEMIKIRDLGREIGAKPLAVQAAEDIAKAVGGTAEDADKMLKGVAESLTKIRTQAGATIGPVATLRGSLPGDQAGAPTVLRGGEDQLDTLRKTGETLKTVQSNVQGGVAVLRGGSQLVFSLADAYKMLDIDLTKYKGTQEDVLKLQKDTFAAFQRASTQKLFDPTQLNEISKVLFQGVPSQTALEIIPAELAHIDEQMKKLATSARGVTEANEEIIRKWEGSKNRLDTIFKDLFAGIESARLQSETSMNEWSANFIEQTLPAWGNGIRQFFVNFWPNLIRDLQTNWDTLNENMLRNTGETIGQMLERWKGYFASVMDMIRSIASSVASGAGKVLSTAPSGMAATPFAEGGYVAGAGSGTSDSILARVSNGEFVMRAAAVDHWGPAFMDALNGLRDPFRFAAGGLVGDLRSFAEGGLVAAAGGTPVHLHLGGRSFEMSASPSVASALVHEASREQMRSAGVKPSWYGGRPGS